MKSFVLVLTVVSGSCLFAAGVPKLPADIGCHTRTGGVVSTSAFRPSAKAFSIAFDLRLDKVGDRKLQGNQGLVFANGNGYDHGFRLTVEPTGSKSYRASLRVVDAAGKGYGTGYVSGIPAEAWTSLALVWDGSSLLFYKDGVVASRAPFAGPLGDPKGGFCVGKVNYGVGYVPFDVRDFLLSDAALDEAAVIARATGGASSPDALFAHFDKADAAGFARFRPLVWQTAARLADDGRSAEAARLYRRLAATPGAGDDACATAARLAAALAGPVELFVSPSGSDQANGSAVKPFATAVRARDELRRLRKEGALGKGATVWFRGGRYAVTAALELTDEDAGTAEGPIRWCACRGERPVFDGGRIVSGLKPCGRGEILSADLDESFVGIRERCGAGSKEGVFVRVPDLYENGAPMQLARHPNKGFWAIAESDRTNGWVKAEGVNLADWANEPELLALGYWQYLWLDETVSVSVDAATGVVSPKGSAGKSANKGAPFCFLNSLKALDEPGEWFIDSAARRLYVWPRTAGAKITLSQLQTPFVKAKKTRHHVFAGLVFENGAASGVSFDGCSDILFCGNVIRNCASAGLFQGARLRIVGNVLHSFGYGALTVRGGDRRLLTSSENTVVNNEIWDIERRRRTYCPAVHTEGVGTVIARNHFHDCPSSAMRLEGNDFLLASNRVERCVTESDDQGAVDIYADPTYAGIRIIGNVWRDCGVGENPFAPCGQCAVRFDDIISGVTVFGNRFYNSGRAHFGAVQINGGRLNRIDNNLFVDCARDVSIGDRAPAWWKKTMTEGYAKPKLDAVKFDRPPYSVRYPYLKDILSWPSVNYISRNVYVNVKRPTRLDGENGCRVYAELPHDLPKGIDPFPQDEAIGPALTPAFRRAKANDVQ